MVEKMAALRKQHRQALASGKTEEATKIRESIRQHATDAFDRGYTLKDLA